MSTVVIMPGGFHPFHAGHMALYNSAREAFPGAEVYVAASNDTKTRPFPFELKEKLAKVAGVQPGHFVQVKSPFQPKEITQNYDPEKDVVIFVRSQKDMKESPIPGGIKKNGEPAYLQPFKRGELEPFGKHAYMAYLPTVEFGPGIKSATEIRNAWPNLNDRQKTAMVMSLYPATQQNMKLAQNVVKMLDVGMGEPKDLNEFAPPGSDDGREPDEEHILKQLAAQWWNGDEDPKAERTLAMMGWEIGQDEGYDNGGAFVVRAGDINGNSYISWPAEDLELTEGWKSAIAGSVMALGALGANAQSMPNMNTQQLELANKYYNVLVQRAKEDGIPLDTRTLNLLKAKAHDAAAQKTQSKQKNFPSQGSERKVAKDINQFESSLSESLDYLEEK